MNKGLRADMMLLVVVTCWGFSFYFTDVATGDMSAFNLNAFRFIVAFLVIGIIMFPKLRHISKPTIKWSIILGTILAMMYACMNIGVANTELSNSGFLCQLTVIATPILSAIIYKKSPGIKVFIVAFMCLVGIALLTLKDGFQINHANFKGDVFCLICGIVYAVQILATEKAITVKDVDPLQLSILEILTTGVISLVISLIFENPHLPTTTFTWVSALFLAIFCTGLAFVIQTLAQQYTTASHVGVILSLEPVIAGFVAYFFAGDILTPKAYLGAALMVAGVFIMEIDFESLMRKTRRLSHGNDL